MFRARTLSIVLAALVGIRGGNAVADEGEGRAPTGTERAVAQEPLAIPFEHRVGERWRLVVERREGSGGQEGPATESEVEAEVLSPYGRDLLVEVRALAMRAGGRRQALAPRAPENAAALDARGGGRLALRVDHQGSASDLLNGEEVRAALVRAGRDVGETAWPAAKQALLEEWNTAYRACGVPLVPGAR